MDKKKISSFLSLILTYFFTSSQLLLVESQNYQPFSSQNQRRVFPSYQRPESQQLKLLKEKCGYWDERKSCGGNMVYYAHPIKGCESLGLCDCDQGYMKVDNVGNDCATTHRMKIYHPIRNQCYPVFSQGPCRWNEWLILNEGTLEPKCVPNQCRHKQGSGSSNSTSDQFWYYDPNRESCYLSLTQGYCPGRKTLELVHYSQYPQCRQQECHKTIAVRSPLACRAGSRYSRFFGSCRTALRLSPRSSRVG